MRIVVIMMTITYDLFSELEKQRDADRKESSSAMNNASLVMSEPSVRHPSVQGPSFGNKLF